MLQRRRPARTVLEQLIRERRETFEEFAESAEKFARDHDEPGTLSFRHLQRLVAGRRPDGAPLGPLRPATARLLERIFAVSIDKLLSPPTIAGTEAHPLRVAIAVVVNGTEVLIVRRRGNDGTAISWQFPAGMVKPGGSPDAVAVTETFEETKVRCLAKRGLGTRLHPITNVFCDYVLCEYLTGHATNADIAENVDVSWIDREKLTRFIPAAQIFPPVLDALELHHLTER